LGPQFILSSHIKRGLKGKRNSGINGVYKNELNIRSIKLSTLRVLRLGSIEIKALVCVASHKGFTLRNVRREVWPVVEKKIATLVALERLKISTNMSLKLMMM
jgi:hypothetical protein